MKSIAMKIMNELGVAKSAINLKPMEISGGMQRRIAMARTIVKQPSLILLDEPTTGLDPIMCENINDLILKTRDRTGATFITITHDLNSALKIADKIVVLRNGEIIWSGKPMDIFKAKNKYVKSYVASANVGQGTNDNVYM